MITGVRGLCNGLGPALFGVAFHVFNVEIDPTQTFGSMPMTSSNMTSSQSEVMLN